MRTTLTLEDDVAQAARSLSRASGKSLGAVVSELMRRGLRSNSVRKGAGGLPTFAVSSKDEIIPSDRAAKLLAED
jgi:hypothetical protein